MERRHLTASALALVTGCFDPAEPVATAVTDPAELLGEVCTLNACAPGQCGTVPDGCRSEMWCGDCGPAAPAAMTSERELSRIFEAPLAAGTFVIATSGLSAVADPVIHVLDSASHEVAFDDNSGGNRNAVVSGTLATTGRVIIRAKSEATRGTAMASVNGPWMPITIGGTFQTMTGLRTGEQLESVKLFGSRTDTHVIYALAADGVHLVGRAAGGGTARAALFTNFAVGTTTFVFGTLGTTSQPARVLRNDFALASHDTDTDGLGNELEAALGTCASSTSFATGRDGIQFDCRNAVDARDTDGDGLSDAIEARGVRGVSTHQPLPLWGADPRHKDLFVEVDASQLSVGGAVPPKLTPAEARRFSDYYGDRTRTLDPLVALYHAASLKNPDQKVGIRTHLDTGTTPAAPGDERLYGDWGGWSIVPPGADGAGQSPLASFSAHMNVARRAVFRYAFQYLGAGGQTPTSVECLGCGAYAWSSGNEIDTFTHESVHAHGLAHSGPAKPVGGVDPNCKAAYFSIVNYAFQGSGFGLSDGLGFTGANNAAVTEWQVVPPSLQSTLAVLRDTFGYRVDLVNGHVDWNRDGTFAPAGTKVRAYTNYVPGAACEFTRYNPNYLPAAMNTAVSPALATFGSTAFLFSAGTSSLRYATAPMPFSCASTSSTPCVTWSATQTVAMDATRGVDAASVSSGLLVVTVGADGRLWYVHRRFTASGIPVWSSPSLVPTADVASGEPALVSLPDGSSLLLYRRATGELVEGLFTPTSGSIGTWTRIGLARQTDGTVIVQAAQAAPGMVQAQFAGMTSTTYGLFAEGPDALLRLWQYVPAIQQWQLSPIPLDDSSIWWRSVSGRPSGAWIPSSDNMQGGRLYVITSSRDGYADDPKKQGTGRGIIMRWSYIHPTTGALRLGLVSGYRTSWDYTYGVDAMFDANTGPNLRVAWSISPETSVADNTVIEFDPKADGIIDFPQTNYNDWPYVGFALCKSLVNPLGTTPTPIECGARPPVTN